MYIHDTVSETHSDAPTPISLLERPARLALAFLWATGIVWASFSVGSTPARASAPAVTGPLEVNGENSPVVVRVSTPTDPVTVSASSLNLSVSNYYDDLNLTASVVASAGSLSLDTTGLTFGSLSTTSASFTVTGVTTSVLAALQSFTWSVPEVTGSASLTVEVTSALPTNVIYFSGNGHLYLATSATRAWSNVNGYVVAQPSRWGRPPHWGTITSEQENQFLTNALDGAWWISASRRSGSWIWTDGPERNTPLVYANWGAGEPSETRNCNLLDCRDERDATFYANSGLWNDEDDREIRKVLVEYSGNGTVDAPHIDTHTVTFDVRSRFAALIAYADGVTASATPTIADWTHTEVTGTIDGALAASLNSVLALPTVTGSAVTTTSAVQTLVDAYRVVLSYAASGGTPPTADHYAVLGVTGLDSSAISRLNGLVRGAGVSGVDTADELAALGAQAAIPPPPPIFVPAPEPEPDEDVADDQGDDVDDDARDDVADESGNEPDSAPESGPPGESSPAAPARGESTANGPTGEPIATDTAATAVTPNYRISPLATGRPASAPLVVRPNGSALVQTPLTVTAYVDGQPVSMALTVRGPNEIAVSGAGFSMQLRAVDASGAPATGDGADFVVPRGGRIVSSGIGFAPDTRVDAWAFSEPVFLGSSAVSSGGSFAVDVRIPDLLAVGNHTLQFTGTPTTGTAGAVSIGIVVSEVVADERPTTQIAAPPVTEPPAPTPVAKNAPPFEPVRALDDPAGVVELATTGVAVLAVASAASAAAARAGSSAGGASRGGERTEERSELGSITVAGIAVETQGQARGDASRLWRWPGTATVDRWSASWTVGLGSRLPLVSRLVADGSALRAIFGGATALLPALGVVFGVWAVIDTSGIAMPPTYALMVAIVLLGVLDAFAGALAFVVYALGVVFSGGIIDVDSIRALMGIGVLCFAPGLIASAFRAIRRTPAADGDELWERLVDFPVVALLAGMTAQAMVWGLNGVAGVDFPFGYEANSVAILVIAAMLVKLIIEESATRWFPARLALVSPSDVPEPSTARQSVTVVSKTAVYVFVVVAILGNVWQLWVAAAMFALPQILGLLGDRLPNSPVVWRLVPLGVPSLVMYFLVGTYSGIWIESWLGETADYARTSFVFITLPFLVIGVLYLIGREPKEEEVRWCYRPRYRWVYRIGGIAMLIFAFSQHMGWV